VAEVVLPYLTLTTALGVAVAAAVMAAAVMAYLRLHEAQSPLRALSRREK
jgi:mevalonate pyrophosphate decarboxylase